MKYLTISAPTLLLLLAAVALAGRHQADMPSPAQRTAEIRDLTHQLDAISSKLNDLSSPAPYVPRGLGAVEMPASAATPTPIISRSL